MFNKKSLLTKIVALSFTASALFTTSVMAYTNMDADADNGIQKTVIETNTGTVIEGMVAGPLPVSRWLAQGSHTQYPAEGGTWEYGFWNVKVRSYYTVNRSHGSTVKMGDRTSRSIDTASGRQSIAELWGADYPFANDKYYYRICK